MTRHSKYSLLSRTCTRTKRRRFSTICIVWVNGCRTMKTMLYRCVNGQHHRAEYPLHTMRRQKWRMSALFQWEMMPKQLSTYLWHRPIKSLQWYRHLSLVSFNLIRQSLSLLRFGIFLIRLCIGTNDGDGCRWFVVIPNIPEEFPRTATDSGFVHSHCEHNNECYACCK